MATLLHIASYMALAVVAWFAALLGIGTLIRGRAWVRDRTWGACRLHVRRRFHAYGVIGRRVPPSQDEPVAFARRGKWL